MRKSGIISLLIVGSAAIALLFFPYVTYFEYGIVVGHERLIDNMIPINNNPDGSWWLSLTPITPFVLIIESIFISDNKRNLHRILFIAQGLLIILFGFLTYVGMNLIFVPHYILITYHFILLHSSVTALWSILLGIPYFDSSKLINNTFRNLSLIK